MCRDSRFINNAFQKTLLSNHDFPISAVITKGNRIISFGVNNRKTHPKTLEIISRNSEYFSVCTHAELRAILNAPEHLIKGATIYVARRSRNHNGFALARPCAQCQKLIKEYELKKVIYTMDDGNYEGYSVGEYDEKCA